MVRRMQREWWMALRQHADEILRFSSEDGPAQHQATAVRELLRYLGVDFAEKDLIVSSRNADGTVRFRNARFRPIDGDRCRQEGSRGTVRPSSYSVPMGVSELLRKVVAALEEKTRKTANRSQLDALVHVSLHGRHLQSPPEFIGDAGAVAELGWRSVSVLWPPYAVVLCAQSRAPKFLRARARRVILYPGVPWADAGGSPPRPSLVGAVLATSAAAGCVVLGGLVLATRALRGSYPVNFASPSETRRRMGVQAGPTNSGKPR
jgi:hypothetical protein